MTPRDNGRLTGVFAGPICGLKYETPTLSGVTNERGEFQYRAGRDRRPSSSADSCSVRSRAHRG